MSKLFQDMSQVSEIELALCSKDGFQYLALLREELRIHAYDVLGRAPVVGDLREYVISQGAESALQTRVTGRVQLMVVDSEVEFVAIGLGRLDEMNSRVWMGLLTQPYSDELQNLYKMRTGYPDADTLVPDVVTPAVIATKSLDCYDVCGEQMDDSVVAKFVDEVELWVGVETDRIPEVVRRDDTFSSEMVDMALDAVVTYHLYPILGTELPRIATGVDDDLPVPAEEFDYCAQLVGRVVPDMDTVDRVGYCYLNLFALPARSSLAMLLGPYPTMEQVGVIVVAGLVFGFLIHHRVYYQLLGNKLHVYPDFSGDRYGNVAMFMLAWFDKGRSAKDSRVRVGGTHVIEPMGGEGVCFADADLWNAYQFEGLFLRRALDNDAERVPYVNLVESVHQTSVAGGGAALPAFNSGSDGTDSVVGMKVLPSHVDTRDGGLVFVVRTPWLRGDGLLLFPPGVRYKRGDVRVGSDTKPVVVFGMLRQSYVEVVLYDAESSWQDRGFFYRGKRVRHLEYLIASGAAPVIGCDEVTTTFASLTAGFCVGLGSSALVPDERAPLFYAVQVPGTGTDGTLVYKCVVGPASSGWKNVVVGRDYASGVVLLHTLSRGCEVSVAGLRVFGGGCALLDLRWESAPVFSVYFPQCDGEVSFHLTRLEDSARYKRLVASCG